MTALAAATDRQPRRRNHRRRPPCTSLLPNTQNTNTQQTPPPKRAPQNKQTHAINQLSGTVDQSGCMLSDDVEAAGYALLCMAQPTSDVQITTVSEVRCG